ncbi:hypothetical protein QBC46DRAFT_372835 [Diplogelasinospora grovesii]|uniref:Secreted protein n=1 Tax=Diplogelasinospora grovesii TaxID=303347 RepID=A0AAN6NHA1_9PEZI|nr:hypothetical protein QBC46DRAFT_372835 [Diplogelasinospora grovesii]
MDFPFFPFLFFLFHSSTRLLSLFSHHLHCDTICEGAGFPGCTDPVAFRLALVPCLIMSQDLRRGWSTLLGINQNLPSWTSMSSEIKMHFEGPPVPGLQSTTCRQAARNGNLAGRAAVSGKDELGLPDTFIKHHRRWCLGTNWSGMARVRHT